MKRRQMAGQGRNRYYNNNNAGAQSWQNPAPSPINLLQQWGNYIGLQNIQMLNSGYSHQSPNNNFMPFRGRGPMQQYPARRGKTPPGSNRAARPWGNDNNNRNNDRNRSNNKRRLEPGEDDDRGGGKRTKTDDEPRPSQLEQYVVPCSKGTEKITVAIWEYFLDKQMSKEDLDKKLMLQQTLHSIIKESIPESRLFIVGSSMNGFATRTSDVDMCLYISDSEIHQKRQAPVILRSLLRSLRCCSFVSKAIVIPAKCPILKFTDKTSGFECDINVNNTTGIRNTHLLRYYAHMDWRVRPLMLFVKRWARYHDINDASKKTISSYSLCLMLLHYLQAGVKPPVLPCLQSMRPDLFAKSNHVCNLSLDLEDLDFTSSNKSTLGELFLGFLDYYANEFMYDDDIISVKKGKKITHNDVSYKDSDWKFLCIEEPFEGTNTARSVFDEYVFIRILRVIDTSFHRLMKDRNTDSILEIPF